MQLEYCVILEEADQFTVTNGLNKMGKIKTAGLLSNGKLMTHNTQPSGMFRAAKLTCCYTIVIIVVVYTQDLPVPIHFY